MNNRFSYKRRQLVLEVDNERFLELPDEVIRGMASLLPDHFLQDIIFRFNKVLLDNDCEPVVEEEFNFIKDTVFKITGKVKPKDITNG